MIKIIKVTGESLSPYFLPDDYVLIYTCHKKYNRIRIGDTVVFHHPNYGRLIKRVFSNDLDSHCLKVGGIDENSISSHKLGPIPYSDLIGKVIYHFKQPRPTQ